MESILTVNETDEGVLNLYYADSDQDGFGNADIVTESIVAADGYVETTTDCDNPPINHTLEQMKFVMTKTMIATGK